MTDDETSTEPGRALAPIAEALAGKRIVVTGATGFLGTALVERLLRSVPTCHVSVLIRPGQRQSVADRVARDILRNDCFDRLRSELGDRFDAEVHRRLDAISGDVSTDGLGLDDAGREALGRADVVIHSAAAVSFDSPIDAATEVNLLGPARVARALAEASEGRSGPRPYLIAVSTAYVAGRRRGVAPERWEPSAPIGADVDWRAEVAYAARCRSDAEAESRSPAVTARLAKAAADELGAAGVPLLAQRAERLRQDFVADRLVELGRARSVGLGWPDVYAMTKALGERALTEAAGDLPVTILRPSIIESALAEPRPGWIRGFRMAEPVIISYARGLLREFPGIPEGIVDVIPVDFVVAALCLLAARGPSTGRPGAPEVVHATSGSSNPMRYSQFQGLIREWFGDHPLFDDKGQPIMLPEWSFPGRGRVSRQLRRASFALEQAEALLRKVPVRRGVPELTSRIDQQRSAVLRALEYVDLYGAYSETQVVFAAETLLDLAERLDPADRETFVVDPARIDWRHYVQDIHLPSIVRHARVRTSPERRRGPSRLERARTAALDPRRQAAVFDLENTLIASNVVLSYAWLATKELPVGERARLVARLLAEAPSLLAADRDDRADFLRKFYRRYEGAPLADLQRSSDELALVHLLSRAYPEGLRRVRAHREKGHRTVLLTGALDFVVEPFRPLFDTVLCPSVEVRDGTLTGRLGADAPAGEARPALLAEWAASAGIDLRETVAYADSASDLPLLEAVGWPMVVNPDTHLAAQARKRGWAVEQWRPAAAPIRHRLPFAPLPAGSRRR